MSVRGLRRALVPSLVLFAAACGGKLAPETTPLPTGAGASCSFEIVAGGAHTCALGGGAKAVVWCWGKNDKGQLGLGTVTNAEPFPGRVEALGTDVRRIVAGRDHTCAIKSDGSLWCWGDNGSGQLGSGTIGSISPTPMRVPGIDGLDRLGATLAAGGAHTCAARSDGILRCWGDNTFGQLGGGAEGPPTTTPLLVVNVPPVHSVSAGGSHTCAAVNDLTLQPWCWGANDSGQLGDGTTAKSRPLPAPVVIAGDATLIDVAAGRSHSCSTRWLHGSPNGVVCWGANDEGQLGLGAATEPKPSPEAVKIGSLVFEVHPGGDRSCARVRGAAWCWGTSSRALSAPAPVPGLPDYVISLAVGDRHSCARNFDSSEIWCWGANEAGQLGTGTADANAHPTAERVTLPCE